MEFFATLAGPAKQRTDCAIVLAATSPNMNSTTGTRSAVRRPSGSGPCSAADISSVTVSGVWHIASAYSMTSRSSGVKTAERVPTTMSSRSARRAVTSLPSAPVAPVIMSMGTSPVILVSWKVPGVDRRARETSWSAADDRVRRHSDVSRAHGGNRLRHGRW